MPTVDTGSLKIHYEMDGSGDTIVFLHGHGGNLAVFDDLAASLTAKHTVLRYDQRGYGWTEKPLQPPYSTELWANDLCQLLQALNVKEAVVVGHSMAGRVCAVFAAKHPELTRGLITLNTTWFGSNPQAAEVFDRKASRVEREGMAVALESGGFTTMADEFSEVRERVRRTVLQNDPVSYALGTRVMANDFGGGSRDDLLKGIKCPTLVLIGDRDSAPLPGAIHMYEEIENARLAVIPKSGHYSMLTRPGITKAVINDFLNDVVPS